MPRHELYVRCSDETHARLIAGVARALDLSAADAETRLEQVLSELVAAVAQRPRTLARLIRPTGP